MYDDPEPSATCQRCDGRIGDQSFLLLINADPPLSAPVRLRVCERCMKSLTRWATRGPRPPVDLFSVGPSPVAAVADDDDDPDDAHSPRGGRRTVYTDELERHDSMIHAATLATVIASFAAAFAVAAVFAYALWRR